MSIVRTTLQGKRVLSYRGKRRLQRNADLLSIGFLSLFLLIVLWITTKAIYNVSFQQKRSDVLFLQKESLPFPQVPVDIFPLSLPDVTPPLFTKTFSPSCLPDNSLQLEKDATNDCQIPEDEYRNVVRILTTPTVTGQAAAHLLEEFLQYDPRWELNTRTFASRYLPEGWIVHVAVLPPLLEAMDLLLHVQTKEEEMERAWLQAIEYTIQRVLQHHCEFSSTVSQSKRAFMSVSLNEVVGFPSAAIKSLYEFLEIQEKVHSVSSSAAALTVIERIQHVITWFETNAKTLDYREWNSRVQHVIEASTRHVSESTNCNFVAMPPNDLAKRVDSALLGTFDCEQYPSIGLCHPMQS
ncbi:hypothetical protein FisN_21Hh222 [Fistulifera solaris]|jgi:hypothetical protein|uniref:Uncharacterized protein n=1 Tax=Fistulifera solaris TaxID=1519565 RepID=A0A1Z5JRY4_FISSO|nr:hypothetical protein FisN_21Hh222 [Fistulifera solaris]|eukprot:GAX16774.1 hypothetical protein FisN_21Hh222 [Fistulifera solaris]